MSHRHRSAWESLALALLVPLWLLATPPLASAQHSRGGGSAGGRASGGGGRSGGQSTGTAVPRGSTPSGGESGAASGSSPSHPATGASSAQPASGSSSSGAATSSSSGAAAPAPHNRPRGSAPAIGEAVPRRQAAPVPPPGGVLVPGGYYGGFIPWGYAGLGLYGGYYAGYYDPWFDPYYGGGYAAPADEDQGALHLKVKQREASVFVDGYYAGIVDDFDGVFQRLHVAPGPHRVEISAPGYEALSFEVRVLPGQTVTYRGELKPE